MRIYCVLSSFCFGTSMCKEALVILIKFSRKKASLSFPQLAEKRISNIFSTEPSSQDCKKEIVSSWLGRLWDTDKIDCFLSGFLIWIYCKKCRRKCQPTPVFLPGEFHGQRGLVGYSSWDCKESDHYLPTNIYWKKRDSFQGQRVGSCLTLKNELSEETHPLTRQKCLWKGTAGWKTSREGNPGELLCCVASSLRFYGNQIRFWVISGQLCCLACIWSDAVPSWWPMHLSVKMDSSMKDSGRLMGHIMGWRLPLFWPLLNSLG